MTKQIIDRDSTGIRNLAVAIIAGIIVTLGITKIATAQTPLAWDSGAATVTETGTLGYTTDTKLTTLGLTTDTTDTTEVLHALTSTGTWTTGPGGDTTKLTLWTTGTTMRF